MKIRNGKMMSKRVVIFIISLISPNLYCWDGQLEGFVLGAGTGTSFHSEVYHEGNENSENDQIEETRTVSPLTSILVGCVFNQGHGAFINLKNFERGTSYLGLSYNFWQNLNSPSNQYIAGLGVLSNRPIYEMKDQEKNLSSFGIGFNVGYGYLVSEHLAFATNLIIGSFERKFPSGNYDKMTVVYLSFSINLIGY